MSRKNLFPIFIMVSLVALQACNGKNLALEGFDDETWRSDPQACKGEREEFFTYFEQNKDLLKGYSESDIKLLLGKPDERELYQRGQWFYIYFFDAGPLCEPKQNKQRVEIRRMEIRLSAVGEVSEVILRP